MKKILVIEDEQAVRDTIVEILNSENFYAISAENGEVGVQMATEFQPNLILCDVMMPKLDGYGVLTQVRQNTKTATIPFVFLTANADKNNFRHGMTLGADDYLTKPFTHSELLEAIDARIGKQKMIEQQSQQQLDELRQSINLALPHELSTVLTVLSGLSQMLVEDYALISREEILEIAENINANSNRLHRLVKNFLLIAKLELLATNPEQIAILQRELLDDTEPVIAAIAHSKAEQYHRENDLELDLAPLAAKISEPKLKKIMAELLDNAFKFSPEGSQVKLFSSCHQDHFILHVIDHGHGMTPEQIAKVGAYMQFDRDRLEQQGAGLGLAITKRLTELHGGKFNIESIPDKQTIVRIALPC
ncbi:MAG TPA: response regulator [Coleofasciculaceae cyanobacterium]|jgi:signal transduction histidine kinase